MARRHQVPHRRGPEVHGAPPGVHLALRHARHEQPGERAPRPARGGVQHQIQPSRALLSPGPAGAQTRRVDRWQIQRPRSHTLRTCHRRNRPRHPQRQRRNLAARRRRLLRSAKARSLRNGPARKVSNRRRRPLSYAHHRPLRLHDPHGWSGRRYDPRAKTPRIPSSAHSLPGFRAWIPRSGDGALCRWRRASRHRHRIRPRRVASGDRREKRPAFAGPEYAEPALRLSIGRREQDGLGRVGADPSQIISEPQSVSR